MKLQKQFRERYLATLKHSDTEETIDLWFYRPVGFFVALCAEKLHLTPNAITVFGIFLGISSGVLMYPTDIWVNLLGMLLLVMADVCDSADGQLARMTKSYSLIGRILDGLSSDIWFASIYICIALRYTPEWGYRIWILAIAAALCHALQAAMADHYRQFHLLAVNGKNGSELDSYDALCEEYHSLSFKEEPMRKATIFFYKYYTLLQEFLNPQMTSLRQTIKKEYDALLGNELSEKMRVLTLPLMKWTNVLTYNWRAITLFLAILLQKPWVYMVCETTVFNVILIYMLVKHEHICKVIKNNYI